MYNWRKVQVSAFFYKTPERQIIIIGKLNHVINESPNHIYAYGQASKDKITF